MKLVLLTACTLLLISRVVTGQEVLERDARNQPSRQSIWESYTVKHEDFSVALPTLPEMTSSVTLQPRLQKNRMERHLKTLLDGVVYSVDVFENPESGESLEDFIAEQIANFSYDLNTARDLTINGIRGKEYSSRDGTVQFFAGPRRLYRFYASGANAANAGVSQFFSSITFGKPRNATEVVDGPGTPLVLEGERIYKGKEVTTKARVISKPEPSYTNEALNNRVTGRVILQVLFSKTGEITNLHVVQGLPHGLTEASIQAARQIRFVPATKDGQPVSMWMMLEYNFLL